MTSVSKWFKVMTLLRSVKPVTLLRPVTSVKVVASPLFGPTLSAEERMARDVSYLRRRLL